MTPVNQLQQLESLLMPSDTLNPDGMFLGRKAEELSWELEQQFLPIFESVGLVVPVKSCSLVRTLGKMEQASVADLSREMKQSHQLILQKVPALLKLRLVTRRPDPDDRRRVIFELTNEGEKQVEILASIERDVVRIYQDLYREIGVDLMDALDRSLNTIRGRSLRERLSSLKSD